MNHPLSLLGKGQLIAWITENVVAAGDPMDLELQRTVSRTPLWSPGMLMLLVLEVAEDKFIQRPQAFLNVYGFFCNVQPRNIPGPNGISAGSLSPVRLDVELVSFD